MKGQIHSNLSNLFLGIDGPDEVFDEADNFDEVVEESDAIINQAQAEKWSEERLAQELSGITVKINADYYRKSDGFRVVAEEGEFPLSKFIDIEQAVKGK